MLIMKAYLITTIFVIGCFAILSYTFAVNNEGDAALYLRKFGYIEDYSTGAHLGRDVISAAIKDFQRFTGLKQTGELDSDTIKMMNTPRCGVKDIIDHSSSLRKKRYAVQGSSDQLVPPEDNKPSEPDTNDAPDLCQNATIDAVTRIQNGSTYVFKGDFYWEILSNGIKDGYPRKISDDWNGLEGNLDAALTWSNGKTFFFKGSRYWRFTNKEMDNGYPKLIQKGFEGVPDMLDAAFVWSGNGKTYFFKGDQFWRYDMISSTPVSDRYPSPVSRWKGLPKDGVDAAFQWENKRTYFFKGDKYYRFNDNTFEVYSGDPPYPRSNSVWWFNCEAASRGTTPTEASLNNDTNNRGSTDQPVPPEDVKPSRPPPGTRDAPDLCQNATIDAVTRTQNGSTYVFKGDFYWKILSNGIADEYPRKISDDWSGLEGNLDAALTWSNGKTFFFKGGRYWRFTNKEMDSGYPKLIQVGFEGVPDMIDAAFVWSKNGKTYFFKGAQYWQYDGKVDPPVNERYPQPISKWNDLPTDSVDAAIQWGNNRIYFFKGDKYYRFISHEVESRDPPNARSTSLWWFHCKAVSPRTDPDEATINKGSTDQPVPPEDDKSSRPPLDTRDAPDLCQNATIDAVTRTQNGNTYVFKGDFYWKILTEGIADRYPRKISYDWRGLEGNLDAALTWSNGKTFFFKGGRYWRFTNKEMDSGYPKLIQVGFEGVPNMIDAALVWSKNGKTYFFKGDQYWRYDTKKKPAVNEIYPQPISNWNGLPKDGVDAAFQWKNNQTYFFKSDKYYRFITHEVDFRDLPYPRSTSVWWFDCKAASRPNPKDATLNSV